MTWVELSVNEQEPVRLAPGAWIGRSASAPLRIDEPTIAEAHAFISLRGSGLRLLALRGRFSLRGHHLQDAELVPGRRFSLAPTVAIDVTEVCLPEAVLGLEHPTLGRMVPPAVASFGATGGVPSAGAAADAAAILWITDDAFVLRRTGLPDVRLVPGDTFDVAGESWRVVEIPTSASAVANTAPGSSHYVPLAIAVRYDTVHIRIEGRTVPLDGMPARIITELALAAVPVEWHLIAVQLWPAESDRARLRMLWDGAMGRLRRSLRARGVRGNLVRTDGLGLVELMLGPEDVVRDET